MGDGGTGPDAVIAHFQGGDHLWRRTRFPTSPQVPYSHQTGEVVRCSKPARLFPRGVALYGVAFKGFLAVELSFQFWISQHKESSKLPTTKVPFQRTCPSPIRVLHLAFPPRRMRGEVPGVFSYGAARHANRSSKSRHSKSLGFRRRLFLGFAAVQR